MSEGKNCREVCRFSQLCYARGEVGRDPFECPTAWKIEDLIMDTKYEPEEDDEEYDFEEDME